MPVGQYSWLLNTFHSCSLFTYQVHIAVMVTSQYHFHEYHNFFVMSFDTLTLPHLRPSMPLYTIHNGESAGK